MKILLVDELSIMYRYHHAMSRNPLMTGDLNTSAIWGLLSNIIDISLAYDIDQVIVCGDHPGKTFRHEHFPEYKGQRSERPEEIGIALPHVEYICKVFNMPFVSIEGLEADDIIGTYSYEAYNAGHTTYIYSSDKDLCQLVNDRTFVLRNAKTRQDGYELWDYVKVCDKWCIANPAELIHILALWGDSSDNYKGLPGCGEKTASEYIRRYGSIKGLYDNMGDLTQSKMNGLVEYERQVMLCLWLATIRTDVIHMMPALDTLLENTDFDTAEVKKLLDDYRFDSIYKTLFGER